MKSNIKWLKTQLQEARTNNNILKRIVVQKMLDRIVDKKPELTVIQGGKEPRLALAHKEPTSICWLRDLAEGTNFIAEEKPPSRSYIRTQFQIVWKTELTVKLATLGQNNQIISFPVNPFRFCQQNDLVEILSVENQNYDGVE